MGCACTCSVFKELCKTDKYTRIYSFFDAQFILICFSDSWVEFLSKGNVHVCVCVRANLYVCLCACACVCALACVCTAHAVHPIHGVSRCTSACAHLNLSLTRSLRLSGERGNLNPFCSSNPRLVVVQSLSCKNRPPIVHVQGDVSVSMSPLVPAAICLQVCAHPIVNMSSLPPCDPPLV